MCAHTYTYMCNILIKSHSFVSAFSHILWPHSLIFAWHIIRYQPNVWFESRPDRWVIILESWLYSQDCEATSYATKTGFTCDSKLCCLLLCVQVLIIMEVEITWQCVYGSAPALVPESIFFLYRNVFIQEFLYLSLVFLQGFIRSFVIKVISSWYMEKNILTIY